MLAAALAHAVTAGLRVAVAVVDEAGHLKAFARHDGALPATAPLAIDKAYSAATCGLPTAAWGEAVAADPALAAGLAAGVDRLIVFGGGVPLTVDGAIVGGVGVSGGTPEQDAAAAQAAAAALAASSG